MNWLVIAAHLLSKVNIQEEMAKPDKTASKPQGLAYITRARVRARGYELAGYKCRGNAAEAA
jgi:hypothetical protein